MRRVARAVPLVRMSVGRLVPDMRFQDPSDWSKPLRMAYEVLRARLGYSEQVALQLVIDTIPAALACARQIDERSRTVAQVRACKRLRKACACTANCAKRGSASLRQDLHRAVLELARQPTVDVETIQAFFDAVNEAFAKHPDEEAAKTANSALSIRVDGEIHKLDWKLEFESLSSFSQRRLETRLSELLSSANGTPTAAEVFYAMAAVLKTEVLNPNPEIATLIRDYVEGVAEHWWAVGLKPTRARHPEDPTYLSNFHRFVELLLTAMIDPWTRRHDGAVQIREHAQAVLEAYRALPEDLRQISSPRLRHSDVELLRERRSPKKGPGQNFPKIGHLDAVKLSRGLVVSSSCDGALPLLQLRLVRQRRPKYGIARTKFTRIAARFRRGQ